MDDLFKVFAPILAVGFIAYYVFTHIGEAFQAVIPWLPWLLVPVALVAVVFALAEWRHRQVTARIWEGMPKEGPMKVNLEIQQRHSNDHRLHVDIKMTKQDWEALVNAGMTNRTLCTYPAPHFTGNEMPFTVLDIVRKKHLDFSDTQEAHAAKQEIVTNLRYLRSHIDSQKTFASTPVKERKESFEI